MRSWFEKPGNGKHLSCVAMKDNSDLDQREEPSDEIDKVKFKKWTYIAFIGKAAQGMW